MPEKSCPRCGTEHGQGDDFNRAFVPYEPAPNGAQAETEWAEDLEELRALVCTGCSYVVGVVRLDDLDDDEEPSVADQFRVDRELR